MIRIDEGSVELNGELVELLAETMVLLSAIYDKSKDALGVSSYSEMLSIFNEQYNNLRDNS